MKKTLLVSIFLVPLMLITTQIAYGANPLPDFPPGNNVEWGNYVGPDITGTLTFEQADVGFNTTFKGSCKNILFSNTAYFPLGFFDCISPEWLLGTCTQPGCLCIGSPEMLPDSLVPYDCYPDKRDVYYPVVYKVMEFAHDGTIKTAKIVARFPTIVPIKK